MAARGLDYRDVTATVGTYLGTHDLSQWNIAKVLSNPLTHDDAVKIAQRVLRDRLGILHRALPAAEPLRFELHTRSAPAVRPGVALTLDWTNRFRRPAGVGGHVARHLSFPRARPPSQPVTMHAPGRPLALAGFCALPAAIALGWGSLATRGIASAWEQVSPRRVSTIVEFSAAWAASGYELDLRSANPAADDIAVLLSIASNVEPAFAASRNALPQFRAILHIKRDAPFPHDIATPEEACDVAARVVEGLRLARDQYQARGTVHLFLAAPAGLAFLVGQSLNTAGPIQTYEHVPIDAVGVYQSAARLMPAT